ncbi:MAG: hypothetical protein ACRDBY_11070, partial [Cetobacterium sp.]
FAKYNSYRYLKDYYKLQPSNLFKWTKNIFDSLKDKNYKTLKVTLYNGKEVKVINKLKNDGYFLTEKGYTYIYVTNIKQIKYGKTIICSNDYSYDSLNAKED